MEWFVYGLIAYILLSVFTALLFCDVYPRFRLLSVLISFLWMSPFLGVIVYLKRAAGK